MPDNTITIDNGNGQLKTFKTKSYLLLYFENGKMVPTGNIDPAEVGKLIAPLVMKLAMEKFSK